MSTTPKDFNDACASPLPSAPANTFTKWLPRWVLETPSFTWAHMKEEYEALTPTELVDVEDERFGLLDEIEETPDLVSRSLIAMEEAIENMNEKEEYETALFTCPEHIHDENFRLAFLRADRFNATAAAKRMVTYWKRKVELFGTEIAFKPGSSIFDLSEDDMLTFAKGGIQALPNRDEFGRTLTHMVLANFGRDVDSMIRYHWVLHHMLIFDSFDSELTQNYGVNLILTPGFPPGCNQLHAFDSISKHESCSSSFSFDVSYCLPMKPVGCQIFIPASNAWIFVKLLERCLDGFGHIIRLRLNVYFLSDDTDRIHQQLIRHGISPSDVPEVAGGSLRFDYKDWLRRKVYKALRNEGIEVGNDLDIKHPNISKLLEAVQNGVETDLDSDEDGDTDDDFDSFNL